MQRQTVAPQDLLEAAENAIGAADQEYEVADDGSHRLIRISVSIDEWLALCRATMEAGRESGRWAS